MPLDKVLYSICIPVFNMADTVELSLKSVINQIDNNFEIIIVDDGSTDGTQEILKKIETEYSTLVRCIYLKPDRRRLLGEVRNISVREARGEHVLLHIDADDVWLPYISVSIQMYHVLSELAERDILMSGSQLNIISRKLALETGPYRNVGRCEDRDMWQRQLRLGNLVWVLHKPYRKRMDRTTNRRWRKAFRTVWGHEMYAYRSNPRPLLFFRYILKTMISGKYTGEKVHLRILRFICALPVVLASRRLEPLPLPDFSLDTPLNFQSLEEAKLSFREHCKRLGKEIGEDFFSNSAKSFFDE